MQWNFNGKTVLVTGGTKGIGAGIAKAFLAAQARVIVCGRNAPEQPISVGDNHAHFLPVNLKDNDSINDLFAVIEREYGVLDVLVNNAGGSPFALADHASPRFHESIIRLNLLAPLHVAQAANQLMQKQAQGGVQLFIASVSAQRPSPGTAAYGAAKAGVLSLVQSLAVEWAPMVRVAAITPGMVLTEQSALHYGDEAGVAAVAQTVPAGRLAVPDDIANACLFLASEQGSYSSGSNLVLHGGGESPAFLRAANKVE